MLSYTKTTVPLHLLLIFLFLGNVPFNDSATYYVDYQGGNDQSAGSVPNLPWKHCPGDPNASSTPEKTILQPGDTIRFKGGVEYKGSIEIKWSGEPEFPIKYEGTTGDWGKGKAIIDGDLFRTSGFIANQGRNFINIQGFEIRNLASGNSRGISFTSTIADNVGVIIENCYIHTIGDWEPESEKIQGSGIAIARAVSCTIRNNEVTKVGNSGIFIVGGSNTLVYSNTVHSYVNWCIGASSEIGADLSALTITSNRLYDFYYYDSGFRERNENRPHSNGIFIYRGSGGAVKNVNIASNLIYNDCSFTNYDGSYMINTSIANSGLRVYNNVLINPHSYYAIGLRDDAGGQVYNNTVFAPRSAALWLGNISGAFDIQNNLFVARQSVIVWGGSEDDSFTSDHNAFQYDGGSNFAKQTMPYKSFTFFSYRSIFPNKDQHSIVLFNQLSTFVKTIGYPTNCSQMELKLRAQSPCIGGGTNLGSLYAIDSAGLVRGARWDIGAFQYTPISLPKSPTGFKISQ